jgi:hypothetical protein
MFGAEFKVIKDVLRLCFAKMASDFRINELRDRLVPLLPKRLRNNN